MTSRKDRIARNEAIFREVNERVQQVVSSNGGEVEFLCECGDETCVDHVKLRSDEYERVRSDPVQFFVKHGHQIPDVEEVVEENERFLLVRKHVEERTIAMRTDPRA